jgi:nicotinamide mononucleotide adenylyltransferase
MISFKGYLQEKGICWDGYKRKKGTKPYEDGSCVKEEVEKHHAMAFGRMNPITTGHEAVVNKMHEVAKEHGATHQLVLSHSQDAKKNPLSAAQKLKHAKRAFPDTKVKAASKEQPTILHHAAAAHASGATHLHVVAGSDRQEEMHNLLHKYNGKDSAHGHYHFKSIKVHSSGERDPDSEENSNDKKPKEKKKEDKVKSISGTIMRAHAASGNKKEFHANAPSKMSDEHKTEMYNDVRKGMGHKD